MNRKRTKSTMDGSWNTFAAITQKRERNLDTFSFIFQHCHSVTMGLLVNRTAHQLSINTSSTSAQAFNLKESNCESDPRFVQRWRTPGYRFSRLDCDASTTLCVDGHQCQVKGLHEFVHANHRMYQRSMANGTCGRVAPCYARRYSRDYRERCDILVNATTILDRN